MNLTFSTETDIRALRALYVDSYDPGQRVGHFASKRRWHAALLLSNHGPGGLPKPSLRFVFTSNSRRVDWQLPLPRVSFATGYRFRRVGGLRLHRLSDRFWKKVTT